MVTRNQIDTMKKLSEEGYSPSDSNKENKPGASITVESDKPPSPVEIKPDGSTKPPVDLEGK